MVFINDARVHGFVLGVLSRLLMQLLGNLLPASVRVEERSFRAGC